MIVSVSRRTDIPAFYAEWFMNRIKAGGVETVNPFNAGQRSWISLEPDNVELLVFWTRNPLPLLPHLNELNERGYRYYFLMTLNAYPVELEPKAPPPEEQVRRMKLLAERIGPEKVIWRYDPVVVSLRTPWEWHEENFSRLSGLLRHSCRRVVVSQADEYRKVNFAGRVLRQLEIRRKAEVLPPEGQKLFRHVAGQARANGLEIYSCAETDAFFESCGISPGACIDADYVEETFGISVDRRKDSGQRSHCRCVFSKDIGAYDTCPHGCVYCYAGRRITAERNHPRHRPEGAGLTLY